MLSYWELLPKSNRVIAYKAMCFIKYLLDSEGIVDFKAETIENKSDGLFNKNLVGRALGLLKCEHKEKPERVNGKPNRRTYWNAQSVYTVYSTWGIEGCSLKQCKVINDTDIVNKQSKTRVFGAQIGVKELSQGISTTPFNTHTLVDIPETNCNYFISDWNNKWNNKYFFTTSYSLINKLPLITNRTYRASKTFLTKDISPCIEVPKQYLDRDDYPIINPSLLNKLGLPLDVYNTKQLPTMYQHRLVCMVKHPMLEWHLPRGHERYMTAHHMCFNTACIHPDHIMPIVEVEHIKLHNSLKYPHAYNKTNINLDNLERNKRYDNGDFSIPNLVLDDGEIDFVD